MIGRYRLVSLVCGCVLLAELLTGCTSTPPVAETPPPPVSVSQPVVRDIVDHDDYEGHIAAAKTVDARARVRGHLFKINFEDGEIVKEGALLFEIDPRPYQAQLDMAKAKVKQAEAKLGFRKSDLARNKELAKTPGAVSQRTIDLSESAVKEGEADVLVCEANQEEAKLNLDYTKVFAPITGKIGRAQVDIGNLVNAGGGDTLLATIVTVDPMYVFFDVDERALLRYRREFRKGKEDAPIKELNIPVELALDGEEGFPHKGVIDFSDNKVNPSTGTIQVRGVLANPKRILDSGMRARVRIPVGDPHKVLMVTERAVGTDQGRKFVYVVSDQNVVERRDVKLGRLSEGLQVVQEGLKEGDRVIVNGIQRVRDGAKVDPKPVAMPGASVEPTKSKTQS
jgi:RND family efflux transporter MFP subunit